MLCFLCPFKRGKHCFKKQWLYLQKAARNNGKEENKQKAEAPFLSSWTLCLQVVLVSAGWHPLFPEQEEEGLRKEGKED